jgi:starvation-inducible DNA-binding protein
LLGSQRQRTGDEILQTLAADKEKLNDVFRKILQEEGTPMKTAEQQSAVIIRGNPKYITGNPKADAFYTKLQNYLEQKGYTVQQDAGEPYTMPPKANVWLGHSRGVNRLRFAPEGTASIAIGALGGINHAKDKKLLPGETPTSSHYLLTKKMIKALDSKLMEGTPMKTASDSVAYTLQNLVFGCLGLALQFKHCHWNVRGPMFKPLHDFLDEVHETLESTSDDLAERLVTLDHPADGNPSGVASGFDHEVLPLKFMQPATIVDSLTDRLKSLCAEFNVAIKKTSSDPVTSNMLQDMTHKLEKHLWMLRSQKENADAVEKEAAVKALNFVMGRSWLTVR